MSTARTGGSSDDSQQEGDAGGASSQGTLPDAEDITVIFKMLENAGVEFRAHAGGADINHAGSSPMDWDAIDKSLSSSERFVMACAVSPTTLRMMKAAIGSAGEERAKLMYADKDGDGIHEIYDLWGTQVEYRTSNDGKGNGPKTGIENRLLPISDRPFFISAGPDQTFGPGRDGVNDDIATVEVKRKPERKVRIWTPDLEVPNQSPAQQADIKGVRLLLSEPLPKQDFNEDTRDRLFAEGQGYFNKRARSPNLFLAYARFKEAASYNRDWDNPMGAYKTQYETVLDELAEKIAVDYRAAYRAYEMQRFAAAREIVDNLRSKYYSVTKPEDELAGHINKLSSAISKAMGMNRE